MPINISNIKKESFSFENSASLTARSMFYYIQSAGHFYCNKDYVTNRKNYNSFLLIYTLAGEGLLQYEGNSYLLDKEKGFLINCMPYQHYTTESDFWEFVYIHFNGSESKSYQENIYENSGPTFCLPEDSKIPKNIDIILKMLENREPRFDIIASYLIVEMLTELLLNSSQHNNQTKIPLPVQQVINKIEHYYHQQINLEQMVANTGISKYHLSRIFKKHTGYSPYEYLINYRLSQGKDLLKNTEKTIKQISEMIGFNSSSHFIKIFRKHEGTTPLQFRKYWR